MSARPMLCRANCSAVPRNARRCGPRLTLSTAPHLAYTRLFFWMQWVAPSDLSLPTCIILFVPHILDTSAEGRMETLGALVDAVANEREKPLVYFWSEAGAQPAVEKALDVGATYPKLLLYSPRHGVGAPLQLALTVQNIQAFILKAALARLPVRPAAIDVQEIASPEPWDLRDGVAPSCADEPNYDDVPLESEI